jgi:hypothetical protein
MSDVLEQERIARENLEDSLRKITSITPESLIRTNQLGTALDFSDGTHVFGRTLTLFKTLKESNLDTVPLNTLSQLRQYVDEALSTFNEIQAFDPTGQSSPASVRDGLIQQVANHYQAWFPQIAPVIAYSIRRGTDFDRLEREARGTLEELNRVKRDFDAKAQSITSEAQTTLDQVRRAAAEVGVAQHAVHFKSEADDHLKRSVGWLVATGILAAVTVTLAGGAVYYYATTEVELPPGQSVQLAIAKIVGFSLLYFAIVWSGRVYRGQWHNYVVNKHRQNALSTFETFVKAASDDQTKNAVLLQATHCIFAPQSTGFVSAEVDGGGSPQILEIVRSATGTDKSGAI